MEEVSSRQERREHKYVIYLHLFAPGTCSDPKKEMKKYYLLNKFFSKKFNFLYFFKSWDRDQRNLF